MYEKSMKTRTISLYQPEERVNLVEKVLNSKVVIVNV